MAYATGTCSNLRDALVQLRAFMKTNIALTSTTPSQAWTELKYVYDNVESADTTLTLSEANVLNLFREDARRQPSDLETNASFDVVATGTITTKQIRWKLRTAKDVTSFMIKASNTASSTMDGFTLSWSDDGSTWTNCYSGTGLSWGLLEEKTFTVGSSTGPHLWWRLLIDSFGGSSLRLRSILCYSSAELVNSSSAEFVAKGPGLANTDNIYVGFRTAYNPVTSEYYMLVVGLSSFLSTQRSLFKQNGCIPIGAPVLPLWDSSMTYDFSGDGRTILFNYTISTISVSGMVGFILPDTSAGQYPYPLFIGGSLSPEATSYSYSQVSGKFSNFCKPGGLTGLNSSTTSLTTSTAAIMLPDGTWRNLQVRPDGSQGSESNVDVNSTPACITPYGMTAANDLEWGECVGGGHVVRSLKVFIRLPAPARILGTLPRCGVISGTNNGARNTGTDAISGKTYIVLANTYRVAVGEYWAMETT